MSFVTITPSELAQRGATTLPNQPTISATALKQEFDAPAKNIIAPKFNTLVSELEDTTAAASLGASTPLGRTGTSVQGVLESLSSDLGTAETDIVNLQTDSHTHANKALLDTYTQTEADIAQAIADDHTHSNKILLDTYDQSNPDLTDAVAKKHDHSNKGNLDKLGESAGRPTYDGNDIGGNINNAFNSIKVGANTLSASGNDTVEFKAGANVTITSNPSDKSISISASGGGGGGGGDMNTGDYATLGITGTVDKAASLYDGTNTLTATIPELNYVDATSSIQTQLNGKLSATVTSPSQGQLITYDGTKFVNQDPDKSFVRYGGAKTFAELTSSLLVAANEDKFFLCTDGGTIAQADIGNWTSQFAANDVIPKDAHIAVINVGTALAPDYRFDDFGGYIDISGKADKADNAVVGTGNTDASGDVSFNNIDDLGNNNNGWEYIPFVKVSGTYLTPIYKIKSLTNDCTSSMSITYNFPGAPNNTYVELRRMK